MSQFHLYNHELEQILIQIFEKDESISVSPKEGMIILKPFDGILVELIYSDSNAEKFEEKLAVSWEIYWKGIRVKFNNIHPLNMTGYIFHLKLTNVRTEIFIENFIGKIIRRINNGKIRR
ncbi:hypothetical protein ACEQPO_15105 [Bacillus sp. SL00103]